MKKLIRGLREFKASYYCRYQELFKQLSHGQKPRVLFITCSDSRVDPNLITQAGLGELFVIRNAGNIIPPYGATNGGEGATIEYAVQALDIKQIIVCGHSHCGAMKGLMKLDKLREEMPLVHDWLKYAEATRRLVKDHYNHYEGEELLEIIIAENVLTQIENLRTYPVIRSKLYQGQLSIYAWIYQIETGEVLAYDAENHAYVLPQAQLPPTEVDESILLPLPACEVCEPSFETVAKEVPSIQEIEIGHHHRFPMTSLSQEQLERIYRGSKS
ncbi:MULTISPECIES: carbonic anhydrase [Nostocales]|uniref:Carbonic anhydrase n=3 Tax=Nostocales TaxID=1161 RepID=A0A0C1NEU2_9CYAN|nr:carbonic anhydrase [Tolypothrix bouteillei]KAF3887674.1 carbonic anhydrase [Tolypothrix bouteillei VB521301]